MKHPLRFALFVCGFWTSSHSFSSAAVIYRETFGNSTGGNVLLPSSGWTSTSNGGSGWRSSANTGRASNLPNVNAGGTSPSQSTGYLLNTTNTVSVVYTTEYTIAQSVVPTLATISWYQGNSSTAETRVAVQIAGSWYATTQTFSNTAVASNSGFGTQAELETFQWTTAASSWRALTISGTTETLGATLTTALPTGNITAFGLYFAASPSQRFDTFQIQTVPEPEVAAIGGIGILSLLMRRRRNSGGF